MKSRVNRYLDPKDKSKTLGIDNTFIAFLDYFGNAKRNFAQHPNKMYALKEAVKLL